MTDYDKDNVSPRPWKVIKDSGKGEWMILDADDEYVCYITVEIYSKGGIYRIIEGERKESAHHIVHCVNLHDELVECLEDLLLDIPDDYEDAYCQKLRNLLARAKGESDGNK